MIDKDLTNKITDMLLSFKVKPDNVGFDYLRTGIMLCYEDNNLKNNITKGLYPQVANIHKTKSDTVERGMRTAIDNAFNNGGLLGKGLGNSTQKYLYLPDSHTDFIFPIVVEELGLLFGLFILLLYLFLLARILIVGRYATNNRNAIMCYGVAFYIFLHIIINLMGVMGMMPMTGVPLPFLSYGGSFTLCLVVALTIVQRVAIENNTKKLSKN